jgi:hypothetical protein
MGDNVNVEQPRGENEQPRAENVDYIRLLRDLFAPVATNFPSCIVLPPTNASHFDLKPHVIQLLPSFHGLQPREEVQGYLCHIQVSKLFGGVDST